MCQLDRDRRSLAEPRRPRLFHHLRRDAPIGPNRDARDHRAPNELAGRHSPAPQGCRIELDRQDREGQAGAMEPLRHFYTHRKYIPVMFRLASIATGP
jgi:hypothetical protein